MKLDLAITAMRSAHRASMNVVREAQMRRDSVLNEAEGKQDGTLVTQVDKASEAAAMRYLRKLSVQAEERGQVMIDGSRYTVLLDPLDGTRPFVNGAMTSTVIVALYDNDQKQVIGCIVGEPISGRVWEAFPDSPRRTSVWQGGLGKKAVVYLDLYPGFTRTGSKELTRDEQGILFGKLFGIAGAVNMMGSNGLHHALVANGGEGVAGAITTALGGPWDVAPALLVLHAGGAARAFSRSERGEWGERDPLDVMSYDFLVTGNSLTTVNRLSEVLVSL